MFKDITLTTDQLIQTKRPQGAHMKTYYTQINSH